MGTAESKDYEDVRLLGRGGFGKVTLVRHRQSKELFALKKIKLRSEGDRRLALQEGTTLFALRHEHVVHAFSFYEKHHWFKQNKVGILMEYCDGGDLGALCRRHAVLTAAQRLSIMLQVCAGLVFLHDRGVLHRDVKPENILLKARPACRRGGGGDGGKGGGGGGGGDSERSDEHALVVDGAAYVVKISDLGVSANLEPLDPDGSAADLSASLSLLPHANSQPNSSPNPSPQSQPGESPRVQPRRSTAFVRGFVGTHAYMAPEVRAGRRYGYPADMYSFGLVCAELLTRECVGMWQRHGRDVRRAAIEALQACLGGGGSRCGQNVRRGSGGEGEGRRSSGTSGHSSDPDSADEESTAESRELLARMKDVCLQLLEEEPERRPTARQVYAALIAPPAQPPSAGCPLAASLRPSWCPTAILPTDLGLCWLVTRSWTRNEARAAVFLLVVLVCKLVYHLCFLQSWRE